jgi:hypothetical protein
MAIKHSVVKASRDKGYASEWNDDHIIDGNVDFDQHQALYFVPHSGTSFPAAPVIGQQYYRTDLLKFYIWDGVGWAELTQNVSPPVGSVQAWLKNYTNTPVLPTGWVECNGQTLSDVASPYNGQVIPNLNGTNVFLRGNATSGTTGGSATLPNHTHSVSITSAIGNAGLTFPMGSSANVSTQTHDHTHAVSGSTGNPASSPSTLPPYYNVMWIMRVK